MRKKNIHQAGTCVPKKDHDQHIESIFHIYMKEHTENIIRKPHPCRRDYSDGVFCGYLWFSLVMLLLLLLIWFFLLAVSLQHVPFVGLSEKKKSMPGVFTYFICSENLVGLCLFFGYDFFYLPPISFTHSIRTYSQTHAQNMKILFLKMFNRQRQRQRTEAQQAKYYYFT